MPITTADTATCIPAGQERRLRLAACTLSDIGWRDHPDYRAEQVFTRILRLPIAGIDHKGRVALALAVYVRYGGEAGVDGVDSVLAMLEDKVREQWRTVGLALRLAYALTGASPERALEKAALRLSSKLQ